MLSVWSKFTLKKTIGSVLIKSSTRYFCNAPKGGQEKDSKSDEFKLTLIDVADKKYTVTAHEGETLLEAGIRNGVPFQKACGGNAECTTCHCHLPLEIRQNQEYEDASEKEVDALEFAVGNSEESRLACCIKLKKNVYHGKTIMFIYNE